MGWRMYQKHSAIKRIEFYAHRFVCFRCRKMFNKHIADRVVEQYASIQEFRERHRLPCPQCGQPMPNMGWGFKPLPRRDVKRWRVLEKQAREGKRFWYVPSWL